MLQSSRVLQFFTYSDPGAGFRLLLLALIRGCCSSHSPPYQQSVARWKSLWVVVYGSSSVRGEQFNFRNRSVLLWVVVCLGEASNMDTGGGNAGSSDAAKTNPNSTSETSQHSGCGCTSGTTITVRVTPTTGGQFDLQVAKTESVENLKKLISKKLKMPKERICLLHRDRWVTCSSNFQLETAKSWVVNVNEVQCGNAEVCISCDDVVEVSSGT